MKDEIFISEIKYVISIVKKVRLQNPRHKRASNVTHAKLSKDDQVVIVDQRIYMSMIGILLYINVNLLGISFFVGVCACYQANPKTSHLIQVKRIIQYISGTSDNGILYSFDNNSSLV